jgi:hypothetical protein
MEVTMDNFDPMDFCGELCFFAEGLIEKAKLKWIPVSERLPEDDLPKDSKVKQIKVLTALKSDKGVRTVRSQMRYRCTWYSDSEPWVWKYSGSEITHWMPLPEPPKEK